MAYYYNVKITDLLSVETLQDNHQFLIANPIIGSDGALDARTPYVSNRINGKTITDTITDSIIRKLSPDYGFAKLINTLDDYRYAEFRFGNGRAVSDNNKNAYGCFNVTQTFLNNETGKISENYTISVDVESILNANGDKTFLSALDDVGAYPGSVFSDGKYFFYRVSQNCVVNIQLLEEINNVGGNAVAAYLLYNTGDKACNTKITTLGTMLESNRGPGNANAITMPIVKNAVIMLGIYQKQPLSVPTDYEWQTTYCVPNVETPVQDFLSNVYLDDQNNKYKKISADSLSINIQIPRTTYQIDVDGKDSSMSNVFNIEDPNVETFDRYALNGKAFTKIASIVELT